MADNIILGFDGLLIISLSAIAAFYWLLTQSLNSAPRLSPVASPLSSPSSLDIIIPAYNEEENIEACVESVLNFTP